MSQVAREYKTAIALETAALVKERRASDLTEQAMQHARVALARKDVERARKALKLRDEVRHLKASIERNRRELARLSGGSEPM